MLCRGRLLNRGFRLGRLMELRRRDIGCFQEAVDALNSLQSNASVLRKAALVRLENNKQSSSPQTDNVRLTLKYLARCGIDVRKLEDRVIHVAGTKGKGSTCAYCESILRHRGYKTGLYTSPHLVSVTERIRIDGQPISESDFARHFWRVYNCLVNNKDDEKDMPSYFKFLTVMALDVFLSENVDVAVIEVGVGGEHDCTNVFQTKPVVGISSLGIDHTRVLGDTLESIAWQKGGIMTPGCIAFTAPQQEPSALHVISNRAIKKDCRLMIAPNFEEYHWPEQLSNGQVERCKRKNEAMTNCTNKLEDENIPREQLVNCSLAIQLAYSWMWLSPLPHRFPIGTTVMYKKEDNGLFLKMDECTYNALQNCSWPGRYQKLTLGGINYFIDGAHTTESIQLAARWFQHYSSPPVTRRSCDSTLNEEARCVQNSNSKRLKILLFNCTGGRDAIRLLSPLFNLELSHVFFTTNFLYDESDTRHQPADVTKMAVTRGEAMAKCEEHDAVWAQLGGNSSPGCADHRVVSSVSSALEAIRAVASSSVGTDGCDVLVTGSLHLVGGVLALLQS